MSDKLIYKVRYKNIIVYKERKYVRGYEKSFLTRTLRKSFCVIELGLIFRCTSYFLTAISAVRIGRTAAVIELSTDTIIADDEIQIRLEKIAEAEMRH